ncbi:uncharacterized protein LOC105284108 isoform X5 [Ooceraea biroi]|uniref:uncharacterized protein LOC105284108 isoform X5 n=1 Tax=Ooceraea biroi TaxID=2015173 RepID=UPI000F092B69|nr:uncharacterized protein LOC105284108 isoform X5 [Ooceraea biroi]
MLAYQNSIAITCQFVIDNMEQYRARVVVLAGRNPTAIRFPAIRDCHIHGGKIGYIRKLRINVILVHRTGMTTNWTVTVKPRVKLKEHFKSERVKKSETIKKAKKL